MRIIFLILLSFGMAPCIIAQQLVDEETQKPLEDVSINCYDAASGKLILRGMSDRSGNFPTGFRAISANNIQLHLSLLGYEERWVTFERNKMPARIGLQRNSVEFENIMVKAIRQQKNPTNTTLGKKDLVAGNLGQDLPLLLNMTPNAVTFSDAGNGVGYTGIRIRGVDPSRINVTVNGIPMNDADGQGVYWVDMPDIGSSIENIQIQRGVGSSTNGTAAFGSSINIQTNTSSRNPFGEASVAGGYIYSLRDKNRYTQKYNARFGTGMIGKWIIEGRLSKIHSDGFVDLSQSDLKSYYISATRISKRSIFKFIQFSGKEMTGQAWNAIPQDTLIGTKNSAGAFVRQPNRTYNEFTYPNQTDNYQQDHYQMFYTRNLDKNWLINTALHYTHGKGYYEEYKKDVYVDNYKLGIDTALHIAQTDIIRRRWLDNYFYGATFSAIYKKGKTEWINGGSLNAYDGNHKGEVIWARMAGTSEINQPYYTGISRKTDFNIYSKVNRQLSNKLTGFADLQIRRVHYMTEGIDDNYNVLVPYSFKHTYNFINPKAGFTYKPSQKTAAYIYYGVSHREPTRDDIIKSKIVPKPERMQDVEAGYTRTYKNYSLAGNLYFMGYKNQLVNDGSINDVGGYNRVNVLKSYRAGIELMGSVNIIKGLQWSGNLALSRNKIPMYKESIAIYDSTGWVVTGTQDKTHKNADLSFSPTVVAGSTLRYTFLKGLTIDWLSKYVSKQYLDNTQSNDRKLNSFWVNDLRMNYEFHTREFKYIRIGVLLNNIFNVKYEPNGYTYGGISYTGQRVDNNFYFPQAGANVFGQLTLGW